MKRDEFEVSPFSFDAALQPRELEDEFEAYSEFDEYEAETSAYPGISCVTPGNPYVLHCFPPFTTELTADHHKHLDMIAEKIRQSFSANRLTPAKPITTVNIVGHSATWHDQPTSDRERNARDRANKTREQLIRRLQQMGLAQRVNVRAEGRSDAVPWLGKPYSSTRGDPAARNDRALNRRVEIRLVGTEPEPEPIITFRAITVRPLALRTCTAAVSHFGGRFRVQLDLNPILDCRRFEYRQDIRGTATIQPAGSTTSLDARRCFDIPGGGLPLVLREDGQIIGGTRPATPVATGHFCNAMTGGVIERFGHRSAPPVVRRGTCPAFARLEDRYLPSQRNGCRYRLNDTYGFFVNRTLLTGATLRLRIVWRGRVIDTRGSGRVVRAIHWGVEGSAVVT